VLAPWSHGRGYASEAVAAAIAWGERALDSAEFACIIDPANTPSIRVGEKAGFRHFAETTYKGDRILILKRPVVAG
jgi:RimJ/RimL family protein N-acetyltransferase